MKLLLARIPVNALGHAHHGDILDPVFRHDFRHGRDLPCPAIDQKQIRPLAIHPFRVFLLQSQRLKRRERTSFIIPKSSPGVSAASLMLNLRYWFFSNPFGPATIIAPTAFVPMDVAVVVHLDPLPAAVAKSKRLGQAPQQLGLRRTFRHLARQGFPAHCARH